jgi:hypothetical protein
MVLRFNQSRPAGVPADPVDVRVIQKAKVTTCAALADIIGSNTIDL